LNIEASTRRGDQGEKKAKISSKKKEQKLNRGMAKGDHRISLRLLPQFGCLKN